MQSLNLSNEAVEYLKTDLNRKLVAVNQLFIENKNNPKRSEYYIETRNILVEILSQCNGNGKLTVEQFMGESDKVLHNCDN